MGVTTTERLVDEWTAKLSGGTVTEHMGRPLVSTSKPTSGQDWGGFVTWVSVKSPFGGDRLTRAVSEIYFGKTESRHEARTNLGAELLRLRRRAIYRGLELWDQDTILYEVTKSRGEHDDEEDLH